MAGAAVVLALGAGEAAQRAGALDLGAARHDPRPAATAVPLPRPTPRSAADTARLRHLRALDAAARDAASADPRVVTARRALADCTRAAPTAPAPDQALRFCQDQYDAVEQQAGDEAYARALAAGAASSTP